MLLVLLGVLGEQEHISIGGGIGVPSSYLSVEKGL